MSIEKCREEFEVWWSQDSQAELRSSCAKGWAGVVWQASREALVIELPDADGLNREHMLVQGFIEGVAHTRAAIEAAGLKVKP
ncbi:hypothetical protein [Pseudomonas veronii]